MLPAPPRKAPRARQESPKPRCKSCVEMGSRVAQESVGEEALAMLLATVMLTVYHRDGGKEQSLDGLEHAAASSDSEPRIEDAQSTRALLTESENLSAGSGAKAEATEATLETSLHGSSRSGRRAVANKTTATSVKHFR